MSPVRSRTVPRNLPVGLLLFLLLLLTLRYSDASTDTTADFHLSHLGYTATTIRHFQLGVNLDLSQIAKNVDLLDKLLAGTPSPDGVYSTKDGENYAYGNRRTLNDLNTTLQATWTVGNPINGGTREGEADRSKRSPVQIASATFGAATGLYKIWQLRKMKKKMLALEGKVADLTMMAQDHEVTLGIIGGRLTNLETWAASIERRVQDNDEATRVQFYVEQHFTEVARQVDEAAQIMDLLLAGQLSHLAIKPTAMNDILRKMSTSATADGHTLLVRTAAEAFQARCSFLPTDTGVFAILHVPMAKTGEVMDLWHLVGTPIAISPVLHMTVHTDFNVIAMSEDKAAFRTMTMAELTVCDKRAAYHYCRAGNIHTKSNILKTYNGEVDDRLCAYFVFEARYAQIRTACRFHVAKPTNQGFLLSGNKAVFVGATPQQGTTKCPGQVTGNFIVDGITTIKVAEGCVAETDYFSVTGEAEPDTATAERTLSWPTSNEPLWRGIDLAMLTELVNGSDSAFPSEFEGLKRFLDASETHRAAKLNRIALWTCLAAMLLGVAGATAWTWRNKVRLQRKMRALLVHGTERLLDAAAAAGRHRDAEQARVLLRANPMLPVATPLVLNATLPDAVA
jgi:hypothetical protein